MGLVPPHTLLHKSSCMQLNSTNVCVEGVGGMGGVGGVRGEGLILLVGWEVLVSLTGLSKNMSCTPSEHMGITILVHAWDKREVHLNTWPLCVCVCVVCVCVCVCVWEGGGDAPESPIPSGL